MRVLAEEGCRWVVSCITYFFRLVLQAYTQLLFPRYHVNPKFLPYPSKHISLRGAEEEKYLAVDVTRVGKPGGQARILEEVELSRSLFELYEGAVVCLHSFPVTYRILIMPNIVHSPGCNIPSEGS